MVLVVEDEDTVQNTLRTLLAGHQYRTVLAQDGAEALAQYRQHQAEIQLVVSDLMMPGMDGFTFIENLKAINPQVPIIALSGVPSHEDLARRAGADTFLAKPFNVDTLLSRIATLCNNPDDA
jgi:hypothetical protein